MRKVVVLFSGGVESTCLLYYYLREGWLTYPVYLKAGYPWERLELENARRLWLHTKKTYRNLMTLRVIPVVNPELTFQRLHRDSLYIPLRNLSLVASAGAHAISKGINHVAIGSLGIYPFPDNNAEYMKELEKLTGLKVHTPFMGMHKHNVIAKFFQLVPLDKTLSCINPKRVKNKIVPCQVCEKCKERREAFQALNLESSTA